jgi:hypothetical protein
VSGGRIRRDLDARSLKQALLDALEVEESEPEPQASVAAGAERP